MSFAILAWPCPETLALIGAFVKRPYPARGRVIGPGFDLRFPESPPMPSALTLDLILRIVTLAAQLGRTLGASDAKGFFERLFAGEIGPDAAAKQAVNVMSTALDVDILRADLTALQLAFTVESAVSAMNKAIDFGEPPSPLLSLTPEQRATFEALIGATDETPVLDLPDGSVRVTREAFDRLMGLIDEATTPNAAPVPLLSDANDAGFAALERRELAAPRPTEEPSADG